MKQQTMVEERTKQLAKLALLLYAVLFLVGLVFSLPGFIVAALSLALRFVVWRLTRRVHARAAEIVKHVLTRPWNWYFRFLGWISSRCGFQGLADRFRSWADYFGSSSASP